MTQISLGDCEEGCGLQIAYDDTMGRHECHICATQHPVSLIYQPFDTINHCSDLCLQIVHNIFFEEITRLLSIYSQSLKDSSYWTPWIGQPRDTKNS